MTIYTFRFQPFARRAGQEPVIGLRFTYNAALVASIKAALTRHRDRARNPAAHVLAVGGWLGEARTWFVEPTVWPQVRLELAACSVTFSEIGWPGDVPQYEAAPMHEKSDTSLWDADEDDAGLPDAKQLYAAVSAAADVLSAPTHELGPDVLVRVPGEAWRRLSEETSALITWKVWHQEQERIGGRL